MPPDVWTNGTTFPRKEIPTQTKRPMTRPLWFTHDEYAAEALQTSFTTLSLDATHDSRIMTSNNVSCLRKQHDGGDLASKQPPSDLKTSGLTTTPQPTAYPFWGRRGGGILITLRILFWLLISAGHYRGTVFQSCDAKVSSLRKRRYAKARIPTLNVYMESLSRFILTGSTV